jgi:DNA-directed RNA polymerase subunit RPC12/RpoP
MSKEKQIEIIGLKKTLCVKPCDICSHYGKKSQCIPEYTANRLYEAGYRKQSEGEWYVNYMMSKKPSKRGRIIQYTTYTCSVCGKPNGRKKSKFCPNCGAKMFIRMTHTCAHIIPNLIPTIEEMKGGAE